MGNSKKMHEAEEWGDDGIENIDWEEEEAQEQKEPLPLEQAAKKEVGQLLKDMKEREKKYSDETEEETNPDFYFSIIFRNSKEMHGYLESHGIDLVKGSHVFYEEVANKL